MKKVYTYAMMALMMALTMTTFTSCMTRMRLLPTTSLVSGKAIWARITTATGAMRVLVVSMIPSSASPVQGTATAVGLRRDMESRWITIHTIVTQGIVSSCGVWQVDASG